MHEPAIFRCSCQAPSGSETADSAKPYIHCFPYPHIPVVKLDLHVRPSD